jgi:hypothetical protein
MKKSNFLRATVLVVVIALGYQVSARAMVVRHVFPHAKLWHQLQYIIKPPYEIATPHRNISSELRFSLLPTVHATLPPCNHQAMKNVCNDDCPINMCYCYYGSCANQGPMSCTVISCVAVGIHAKIQCFGRDGTGICTGCPNNYQNTNCAAQ